jgi:acetyltransferase-like isoleucine patch superfamily enzyme
MRVLKEAFRKVYLRPAGVRVGDSSRVKRPWKILGGKYMRVGSRCVILEGLHVELLLVEPHRGLMPQLVIEDDVYIGRNAFITAVDAIRIGAGSVLSDSVYITDESHGMQPDQGLIMSQPLESKGPVSIGRNCFIGYRAAIMPGVTLGDHCIVGVNSTVTKSYPSFSMLAGSPARIIKTYSPELGEWTKPSIDN